MRITIFNGEPDAGSAFHAYVHTLAGALGTAGHAVEVLDLATLELKGCSGCFQCWLKTPGRCQKRDDSGRLCQAAMAADLVLLASPVTLGFTSVLLKRAADQMIPLVHPYLVMEVGEMHHRPRYARYPGFALLLAPGPDAESEDLALSTAIWTRTARNLKFPIRFTGVADRPAAELAREVSRALTAAA